MVNIVVSGLKQQKESAAWTKKHTKKRVTDWSVDWPAQSVDDDDFNKDIFHSTR